MAIFKCTLYSLPDFVFRSCLRQALLRSASKMFTHLVLFLSELDANRCLLWWLFLHRRLRSRQRGSFCNERLCWLPGGSLPKSVICFYPNNLKNPKIFPASLSASIQGVNSNFFPSFVTLKSVCHHSACLSLYRSKARERFDYVWILHRFLLKSSRKYFKFYPLNWPPFFYKNVEIKLLLVEKTVENFPNDVNREFKEVGKFLVQLIGCGKPWKIGLKKK